MTSFYKVTNTTHKFSTISKHVSKYPLVITTILVIEFQDINLGEKNYSGHEAYHSRTYWPVAFFIDCLHHTKANQPSVDNKISSHSISFLVILLFCYCVLCSRKYIVSISLSSVPGLLGDLVA